MQALPAAAPGQDRRTQAAWPGRASLPHAPLLHVGLFIVGLLLSGLAGLIALTRLGIRVFWDMQRPAPHLQWLEAGPVGALLLVCLWLALLPEAAMAYCAAASQSLYDISAYIHPVVPLPEAAP